MKAIGATLPLAPAANSSISGEGWCAGFATKRLPVGSIAMCSISSARRVLLPVMAFDGVTLPESVDGNSSISAWPVVEELSFPKYRVQRPSIAMSSGGSFEMFAALNVLNGATLPLAVGAKTQTNGFNG